MNVSDTKAPPKGRRAAAVALALVLACNGRVSKAASTAYHRRAFKCILDIYQSDLGVAELLLLPRSPDCACSCRVSTADASGRVIPRSKADIEQFAAFAMIVRPNFWLVRSLLATSAWQAMGACHLPSEDVIGACLKPKTYCVLLVYKRCRC
jgi:hypothetical protein